MFTVLLAIFASALPLASPPLAAEQALQAPACEDPSGCRPKAGGCGLSEAEAALASAAAAMAVTTAMQEVAAATAATVGAAAAGPTPR